VKNISKGKIILNIIFLLFLSSCSKDEGSEVCDLLVCYNGGGCVDGICQCPAGYEGFNCLDVLTPKAIYVTKIQFSEFPSMKGIHPWDFNGGSKAEPFMRISRNGIFKWDSEISFHDADPNGTYLIIPDTTIKFPRFDEVTFSLLDWDDIGGDDLIDTYTMDLFTKERGLRTQLVVNMLSGTKLTVWLRHEF